MWKVCLNHTLRSHQQHAWCDTQISCKRKKCNICSDFFHSLFNLSYKQKPLHFDAAPFPTPFMSLDISTKSQRVAPQARMRYLVIHIEIYSPKWEEGEQADCLCSYRYPLPLSILCSTANLLVTHIFFLYVPSFTCKWYFLHTSC